MRLAAALLALAAMTTQAADKEHVHDDGVATMAKAHAGDTPAATPLTERPLPQPAHPPLPRMIQRSEEEAEIAAEPASPAPPEPVAAEESALPPGPQAPKPRGRTPAQRRPDHDHPLVARIRVELVQQRQRAGADPAARLDVPGAVSPCLKPTTNAAQFFRVKP